MQRSISNHKYDILYKILGAGLIILLWQILSMLYMSVLVPSPAETLTALKNYL